MQKSRLFVSLGSLVAVICGLSGARALASTPYAITATNVTMPSSGYGSSQFTVTGIPGAGTVTIGCLYTGPITAAKIPEYCGTVGAPGIPVQAGETTFSGTILFIPYGQMPPPGLGKLRSAPLPSGHLPAAGLVLAGVLLLGFGLRRRARGWLALAVLAAGTLAGVGGISGCIIGNAMTPGTYQYTISAGFQPSNTNVITTATANINVTVP
jgi:hypothetical protein